MAARSGRRAVASTAPSSSCSSPGRTGSVSTRPRESVRPRMSFLRRVTSAPSARSVHSDALLARANDATAQRRTRLVEQILEAIADVPGAVETIRANEGLRQRLADEVDEETHEALHRFVVVDAGGAQPETRQEARSMDRHVVGRGGRRVGALGRAVGGGDGEEDKLTHRVTSIDGFGRGQARDECFDAADGAREKDFDNSSRGSSSSSDSDSGMDDEYENDLAEAVHQLCMTDETLTAMNKMISDPIGIVDMRASSDSVASISTSPPSSSGLAASPGATFMDGEPVSALWPRQPDQFAFTQEEDQNVRAEDEVYSELVSSVCEDDTFQDDCGDDEDDADEGILDGESESEAKLFHMDDDDVGDGDSRGRENELDDNRAQFSHQSTLSGRPFILSSPTRGQVTTFQHDLDGKSKQKAGTVHTVDIKDGDDVCIDLEGSVHSEGEEDGPKEYEEFQLRIIREKNRTGFEPNRDWRPRAGVMIGNRYKVELAIGEAVFSRTYKCIDTTTDQVVCLKIIKNNKEYFDQGVDEIRVLEYIDHNCKVDERHLVRLLDAFYFREHLVIVTELLRDNLYEFSRLLLQRGVINYFSIPRLKKITIEVLEALDTLHSLGIVHCDLKPENILIQNFSACTVKVIDFGSACFTTDELTSYVQSRSYRAPEVILGLLYDTKIDLWSLGCVVAEMYTGEVLFRNDSEQTLLARILTTIGPIPASLLADREELQHQLLDTGLFTLDHMGNGVLTAALDGPTLEEAVHTKDADFLAFLRALLQMDPLHRVSAREALAHPWLQTGVFADNRL